MKADVSKGTVLMVFAVVLLSGRNLSAVPVEVPVGAPSRLQTLERKASEYERYKAQYLEIQELFDNMLALLPVDEEEEAVPTPETGYGMLSNLLEKANQSDALGRELKRVQAEKEHIRKQYEALKEEHEEMKASFASTADVIQALETESEKWKVKSEGLRETIERLLLGEFEYYEVKEGDSLQSIAANPMVYGDPLRATWLRQANHRQVENPDNLSPGEVLVVPRFPRNGSYEF
ncbi:LysM peptidoglycan-binding domain-containing protein [Pontiella agarivorans]|uniref:LysM peptidoglycan-binding domain-containing protein n=1 Tax=Pontiella agarivorans TaxID=3038953 RepID=A0ABU5MSV9_9BACT|nr:LysM peptidoglycan-binding domain-containing protein [Pontiella agarivorans]MDZ8117255.1 LysM peptidoglycan-binding domain-containing protein [Pontiella agarivorans]